jgi:hypothetical protein
MYRITRHAPASAASRRTIPPDGTSCAACIRIGAECRGAGFDDFVFTCGLGFEKMQREAFDVRP